MTGETTAETSIVTLDETRQTENTARNENTQNSQAQRSKTTTYTDKFF